MADWKKIIVSGSRVHLNDVTSSGTIKGPIITSSNLNPLLHFNGNRTVSNTNLPTGIYNTNFGTDGDLTNWINAVFFTNTPPVIPPSQSFSIQEWTQGSVLVGSVSFSDAEYSNLEIDQSITFTIESNPFFEILNGEETKGHIKIKDGIIVSKSLNTHLSASILTYPLDVTLTDEVGVSDTEKVYIHIIPNEKPILKDNSNSSISTSNPTNEVNEYGDVKTIYIYTASARPEESIGSGTNGVVNQGNGFGGFAIKYTDANDDNISFEGDYTTQLDVNGEKYIDFINSGTTKMFRQITASFDFESSSFFNFTITASDEHHPNLDTSSVVYLKYHLPITDNPPPAVVDQNFLINENSVNGLEVTNSPINITDPTEDLTDSTAFFLFNNFNLISATQDLETELNYILQPNNITGSLFDIVDSDYFKPTEDPFSVDLAGRITKKTGAFLNADIAKYYYYSASVTDIYNENQSSSAAIMRIEVQDDVLPTVTLTHATDNYIIESAPINQIIVQNSHGNNGAIESTPTTVNSNDTTVNWEINTVPSNKVHALMIGGNNAGTTTANLFTSSNAGFRSNIPISESVYTFDAGSTIKVEITASKNSFPSSQVFNDYILNIAKNHSPVITAGDNSFITAFNLAIEGSTLYTLTFADVEGDATNFNSFTLTGPQSNTLTQLSTSNNGSSLFIKCLNHLSASTAYNFTASIKDVHGFRASSISRSFTVGTQNTGIFNKTSGTYYLIESALSGSSIVADVSGRIGTEVSFSVDYGSAGGNPTVQSFTASIVTPQYNSSYPGLQDMFSISSGSMGAEGGLLTIKRNISESNFNQDGNDGRNAIIKVSYQDQYGNIGESSNIPINPVDNLAPVISNEVNSTSNYFDYIATNNTLLKQYDISDHEEDNIPNNIAITSSNTTNGLIVENNATNLYIKANQSLSVGTYHFTASINDIHSFRTSSVSGTINIAGNTEGTLTANTSTTHNGNGGSNKFKFFIEEDGRNNNIIHTTIGELNGTGIGTQADLGVNYGSTGLAIQAFSISSPQVDIDITSPGGLLTLGENVSGSFTPTQISNGTAIITASISFTDDSPSNNQNSENIYIQVFPNASLGTLTTNKENTYLGKPLFYIEECGITDNAIHTQTGEASGKGNGATGSLGGSYLNQNNNLSGLNATNFRTSSNTTPHIKINSSTGNLTLGQNISGSFTPTQINNGAYISVPVSFNDTLSDDIGDGITIHDIIYVKLFPNASLGTLTDNTNFEYNPGSGAKPLFFIQEYAINNAEIHTSTGIVNNNENGSQADLGVNYGSTGLSVANFTVVNSAPVDVDINSTTGKLSIGENISGSVSDGTIITVNISFRDNGPSPVTLHDTVYVEVFPNASLGVLDLENGTQSTHNGKIKVFVQECAESGDIINWGSTFNHTQANLGVIYNNEAGSATGLSVANFITSSNSSPKVSISNIGLLSMGENISGSVSVGDIFPVNISFTDNGPTLGSGSLNDLFYVEIISNSSPSYSSVDTSGNTQNLPIPTDTIIRTFTISDTEDDFPYTASLSGTNGNLFHITANDSDNDDGTLYSVKALNTIENESSNQNLVYRINVTDNVGKTNNPPAITTNFTLTPPTVFCYSCPAVGFLGMSNPALVEEVLMGGGVNIASNNQSVTNVGTGSVLAIFQSGGLNNDLFLPSFIGGGGGHFEINSDDIPGDVNDYKVSREAVSTTITDLEGDVGIKSLGEIDFNVAGNNTVMFLFPSTSLLSNKPGIMATQVSTVLPTTKKLRSLGSVPGDEGNADIIYFDTSGSYYGYNRWGMIYNKSTLDGGNNTAKKYVLLPSDLR